MSILSTIVDLAEQQRAQLLCEEHDIDTMHSNLAQEGKVCEWRSGQ